MKKQKRIIGITLGVLISMLALATASDFGGIGASGSYVNRQNYQPSFETYYGASDLSTYWPQLNDAQTCEARQDLILQVSPLGCQPAVVRSDLLAEQNVPVFCQIDALKLNPLLDIKEIDLIRFTGTYPKDIIGTSFHPARAALRTRDKLLGSPLINNIGYLVVILKKNEKETTLPKHINLTLRAKVLYNADNALGVGRAEFVLQEQDDEEWHREKVRQSFWNGRYFIRLERADPHFADLAIYHGERKVTTIRAERGKESRPAYLPGFFCQAGIRVAYDGFEAAQKKARLEIGDEKGFDVFDVYVGSRFLNGQCSVERIDIDANTNITGNLTMNCGYRERLTLKLRSANASSNQKIHDMPLSSEAKEQFEDAIKAYEEVAEKYPIERQKAVDGGKVYGQEALLAASDLAQAYGQMSVKVRLMNTFIQLYPDADRSRDLKQQLTDLYTIDSSDAASTLLINNVYKSIRLVSVSVPKTQANAELIVGTSTPLRIELQGSRTLFTQDDKKQLGRIVLDHLDIDRVTLTAYCTTQSRTETREKTVTLRLGEGQKLCGQFVKLDRVNMEEVARVRLLPEVRRAETEANVSVRIGIEKRALQLSPEKTKEMVENLNKSIQKWQSIEKNLGNVVTGLKTACFATTAVLTAKNFFTSLTGDGISRQTVMRGDNGWTNKCKELVAEGKSHNLNACYLEHANEIKKDVDATTQGIQSINRRIEDIERPLKRSSGLLGLESSVEREESASRYEKELLQHHGSDLVPGAEGTLVPLSSIVKEGSYKKGEYSYDQLKQYDLYFETKGRVTAIAGKNVASEAQKTSERITETRKSLAYVDQARKLQELGYAAPTAVLNKQQKKVYADVVDLEKLKTDVVQKFKEDKDVSATATIPAGAAKGFESGIYVLGLQKTPKNEYLVKKAVVVDAAGKVVKEVDAAKFASAYNIGTIIAEKSITYANRYKNAEITYFETEPYKGMPAIVPFDTVRGWYAATKQNLPVFGGLGGFEASGRVSSFWLCNVGSNGLQQFEEGLGDDICQLINLNTGQPLGNFPGLDERQARDLVSQAVQALTNAANQYGNKVIKIRGESFVVGKPAVSVPAVQCQDFMDPKECHLLFNVCDPVICPASRCDFGGKYPVADVIQTGIIGSTLLCLPNVQENIYVPVCLTGIHAGVEGYVSILKNHRDCLQESLATGKSIALCDQIYSVYACEFFWRQIAPVANVLLPKLVELAYGHGQGTRGGGEYLTVMGAWQNTKRSLDYFTQVYAVNSLKAFQLRSIEEAGGEFCKAFISAKAPTAFKSLIEPDSPPQFHAWFSSIRFTDTTVPATAQYKVFYHVYAGKDSGVYYRVALKSPPESSYYYQSPVLQVAAGFIARGEYASQTKDFTAPEGYKELCVDVNGKEECGFKEVSTSFAINQIRDRYAADQIQAREIHSEKECISGKPLGNPLSVVINTNPQAAIEESLNPELFKRGIVRICSTQNPGSSTEPSRFVEVGICDDPKVKCWLDQKSVENAISDNNFGVRNETLSELERRQKAAFAAHEGVSLLEDKEANARISVLNERGAKIINDLKKTNDITTAKEKSKEILKEIAALQPQLFRNDHKAEVLLLKASMQDAVARVMLQAAAPSTPVSTQLSPQSVPQLSQPPSKKWTLDTAIEEVKQRTGTYSDNQLLIDELYTDGMLTTQEYEEINGKGFLNREENMMFVRDLLLKKKLRGGAEVLSSVSDKTDMRESSRGQEESIGFR